jgi:2'-5' RNA ligase
MALKKYFIAVVIPEPWFGQIEQLKQELRLTHGLKGALRSPAHITLHRPFEWKEEKEEALIAKLKSFEFKNDFAVQMENFAFFEPRVIYVNVIPDEVLEELHERLKHFAQRELKLYNEVNDTRGFHPHITVAFRDLKKTKFYALQPDFSARTFSGRFDYKGFSLLRMEKSWEEICFFPSR